MRENYNRVRKKEKNYKIITIIIVEWRVTKMTYIGFPDKQDYNNLLFNIMILYLGN